MSNDLIYICYVPANLTMGAFYHHWTPVIIDNLSVVLYPPLSKKTHPDPHYEAS